jgi:hypothetical protein
VNFEWSLSRSGHVCNVIATQIQVPAYGYVVTRKGCVVWQVGFVEMILEAITPTWERNNRVSGPRLGVGPDRTFWDTCSIEKQHHS